MWGVQPGVYTFTARIEAATEHTISYREGIDVYMAVASVQSGLTGPTSSETMATALPKYRGTDDFEESSISTDWTMNFDDADSDGWSIIDGGLRRSALTGPPSTALWTTESGVEHDQWIAADLNVETWTDFSSTSPRVGLVGRCVDDDHCVMGYLDPQANKARIIIKHPSIEGAFEVAPFGWDVVGRSEDFDELGAVSTFMVTEDTLDPVLGPINTRISLDFDGDTIRMWLGEAEDKRLIAAALDRFYCDDETGDARRCIHISACDVLDDGRDFCYPDSPIDDPGPQDPKCDLANSMGIPLTETGPAGFIVRRVDASFDNFSIR
jgi:hypothetical protein